MVTMLVPATGGANETASLNDAASLQPAQTGLEEADEIAWEQAPASPAAATGWGVGASTSAAVLSTDGDGTFVSTDGANTWDQVDAGVNAGTVEFDPSDPDVGYVGGFDGLARTTDGGETFEHILDAHNVRVMSVSQEGTLAIGVALDGFDLDILVSEDHGDTWEDIGWPSDQYTLYGLEFGQSDDNLVAVALGTTWVTTDGGQTWTVDEDDGAGTLAANADGTLWQAGYGDFEVSTDGGLTWETVDAPMNPKELAPRPGGGVFAAGSSGIIVSEDGESWTDMGAEEIGWATTGMVADPDDPDAVIVSDENIGVGWIGPVGEDAYAYEGRTTGLPFVDVTALGSAPDGSILLAGSSHGAYASTPGSDTFDHLGAGMGMGHVGAVAAAPGGEVLYVGGQNMIFQAFLQISQDAGATWQATLPIGDDSSTRDVAVHPQDEDRAWAAIWVELGDDVVFETTDAGDTWEPIFEVPQGELMEVAYDEAGDRLLIATSTGVFAYDAETGLSLPVSPAPASSVGTSASHAYATGLVDSVWSDRLEATGIADPFVPWADTGGTVDELVATSQSSEHVVVKDPDGLLHHCSGLAEDPSGACSQAPLPEGETTALAAANGQAWAGTSQHGVFQASLE